jgi:hypothetical protein
VKPIDILGADVATEVLIQVDETARVFGYQ